MSSSRLILKLLWRHGAAPCLFLGLFRLKQVMNMEIRVAYESIKPPINNIVMTAD